MNYKKQNNEFGFTLAEVMVAAGLIGVLSVAVMNMMSNINRTSKRASQIFNVQQETQRITTLLTSGDACRNTLQNLDLGTAPNFTTSVDVPNIRDDNNNVVYAIGKELGASSEKVNVEAMVIRRLFDPNPPPGAYGAIDSYTVNAVPFYKMEAQLLLTYRKGAAGTSDDVIKNSSVGGTSITKRISMNVIVNAAGRIQSCFSTADEFLDSACENLGGTVDGVDNRCKDVKLRTLRDTGITSGTIAATIGDDASAAIPNVNGTNAPLRVWLGVAGEYMSVDSRTIQTRTNALRLNPFGVNIEIGNSGTTTTVRSNMTLNTGRVFTMEGTSYINFASDKRYKHAINEIENVLDKLDEIRGVEFVWNSNNRRDIGYIAQEIEKVFPEVVHTDEKGMKSVQYTKMPAVNTAAIKELKKENDELKFRLNLVMKALCNSDDADKYEDLCLMPVAPLE